MRRIAAILRGMRRALWWMGRLAGRAALELLYPSRCWLCEGGLDPGGSLLCRECRDVGILGVPPPVCARCAGRLDGLGVCGDCLGAELPFERVVTAGAFEGTLRRLVHGLKFNGRWHLALPLAELLAAELERQGVEAPDLVVPVPLVLSRRLRRGYNQSALVARELARRLGREHAPRALRRRGVFGRRQTHLSRRLRARNVRGAFVAGRRLPPGASVLLVDDVVTTGSTVAEAAAVLRAAGASRVVVACAARTITRGRVFDRGGRPSPSRAR